MQLFTCFISKFRERSAIYVGLHDITFQCCFFVKSLVLHFDFSTTTLVLKQHAEDDASVQFLTWAVIDP